MSSKERGTAERWTWCSTTRTSTSSTGSMEKSPPVRAAAAICRAAPAASLPSPHHPTRVLARSVPTGDDARMPMDALATPVVQCAAEQWAHDVCCSWAPDVHCVRARGRTGNGGARSGNDCGCVARAVLSRTRACTDTLTLATRLPPPPHCECRCLWSRRHMARPPRPAPAILVHLCHRHIQRRPPLLPL